MRFSTGCSWVFWLLVALPLSVGCSHEMTRAELIKSPVDNIWNRKAFNEPPAGKLRPMADWEMRRAIILRYPPTFDSSLSHTRERISELQRALSQEADLSRKSKLQADLASMQTDYRNGLDANAQHHVFWQILRHAAERSRVLLAVPGYEYWHEFIEGLNERHLTHLLPNVELLTWKTDSVWVRDYGPLFARGKDGETYVIDTIYCSAGISEFGRLQQCVEKGDGAGVRPNDDQFPYVLAQRLGTRWIRAPLVLDGGNLQMDNQGTCYTSRKALTNSGVDETSVRRKMHVYLGCRDVIFLEPLPLDGTSHVDMFFRVTARGEYLLADYRPVKYGSDLRGLVQEQVRQALDKTAAILHAHAPKARIYRVPMPEILVERSEVHFASFLNFLQVGDAVLMPAYSWSLDQQVAAASILKQALGVKEIIPIDSDNLARQDGAIHCLTSNLPEDLLFPRRNPVAPTGRQVQSVDVPLPSDPGARRHEIGKRIAINIPAGSPTLGTADAPVRVSYVTELSTETPLRLARWVQAVTAFPGEVQLSLVLLGPAVSPTELTTAPTLSLTMQALLGAHKENRFFWAWDALMQPWRTREAHGEAPRRNKLSSILTALYNYGIDTTSIEQSIFQGSFPGLMTPPFGEMGRSGISDMVFVNGIPTPSHAVESEIFSLIERERKLAQRLIAGGVGRGEVYSYLVNNGLPESQAPAAADLLALGDPQAPIRVGFYHDYGSPHSKEVARKLQALLKEEPHGLYVQVRCMSLGYHRGSQDLCEMAYIAAQHGAFAAFHERATAAAGAFSQGDFLSLARELKIDPRQATGSLQQHEHEWRWRSTLAKLLSRPPVEQADVPLLLLGEGGEHESTYDFAQWSKFTSELQSRLATQQAKEPIVWPSNPKLYNIPVGGVPVLGPSDAKVTAVLYADFQCPYSASLTAKLLELRATYHDDLRIVFKQYPNEPLNPQALLAAQAALAANEQGKFWEMQHLLFAGQKNLSLVNIDRMAEQLHLDMVSFRAAIDQGRFDLTIRQQQTEAASMEQAFIPSLYVNGHILIGNQPLEAIRTAIDYEQRRAEELLARGVERKDLYTSLLSPSPAILVPAMNTVPQAAKTPVSEARP